MRALRAISAIFGTPTRLDRQQLAELHFPRFKVLPVGRLRPEQHINQPGVIDRVNFFFDPIVPQSIVVHDGIIERLSKFPRGY